MPPKRTRRFQGLYYHSSPPKVLPMDGHYSEGKERKRRNTEDFSIKLSTIRIWIHEKDIGNLTRVVWAGQGNRLCQQASNNPRIRRFLAAVPHVMNAIKDVHKAVVDNNLETLQAKLEPPVPIALITCRDANGLNIIHKAAGLGHTKILEYLLSIWPEGAHETDITGKTPLHWAASAKNNMRCYTLLTEIGCNEEFTDYKMKTPSFYRHKSNEIERAFLTYVPDAPRVPYDVLTDWDALNEDSGDEKKFDIKMPIINGSSKLSKLKQKDAESVETLDEDKILHSKKPNKIRNSNIIMSENNEASDVQKEDEKFPEDMESKPTTPHFINNEFEENTTETRAKSPFEIIDINDTKSLENYIDKDEVELEMHEEESENEEEDKNVNNEDEIIIEAQIDDPESPSRENSGHDDKNDKTMEEKTYAHSDEGEKEQYYENNLIEEDEQKNYESTSHSSSLAIEGFVQGESVDNTVQSQLDKDFIDQDAPIQDILALGDMEKLAQIVLNGKGSKLLNFQAHDPEIQAFLNNIPNYMDKIRRVHEAARNGSFLILQQALDRRKFAIAKDDISPNGATPLHVAVLFGHSDIVRYLGSRFPETLDQTDYDGRTALHYAATIADNGHFYNLLLQHGANPKLSDKFGHSAEFYNENHGSEDILKYTELLNRFGAENQEVEILNDQGQVENVSYENNPIFRTEQGKYLAHALADPLIKALTEISNKRPADPIAFLVSYLQNYIEEQNPVASSSTTNSTVLIKSNSPHINLKDYVASKEDENASFTDEDVIPQGDDRDEHGQSMLHFASARAHKRGGLKQLIEESNIDISYRDELYRTARDVSLQANQPENAREIDRYLLSLAAIGDVKPFQHLLNEGYDHIVDVVDDNDKSILDVVKERGHTELQDFFKNLRHLEELREELHEMIRQNASERVKEITTSSNAEWLLKTKNYYGRTALHIVVLKESEELLEHCVQISPEALKVGDNLERTVLHYAMGTNSIESFSRILIQNGAERTAKDLKGRQPTYYFMNKADILRLQEEEDENR